MIGRRLLLATALTTPVISLGASGATARERFEVLDLGGLKVEVGMAGEGRDILVLHGAGGGVAQGLLLANTLTTQGFRVVAPARFGYDRSGVPAGASPAVQAEVMAALMDRGQVRRFALVGISAGAPAAVALAARWPERVTSLALLVPAGMVARAGDAVPGDTNALQRFGVWLGTQSNAVFGFGADVVPDFMVRTLLGTPPDLVKHAAPQERRRVRQVLKMLEPIERRRRGIEADIELISRAAPGPYDGIRCPTLVVSCADDLYGTYPAAERIAAAIPRARFISYPTGGHLWVGHDAEVMAAIAAQAQA